MGSTTFCPGNGNTLHNFHYGSDLFLHNVRKGIESSENIEMYVFGKMSQDVYTLGSI